MSLNAHAPTLVGLEWFPYRQRGLPVDVNRRWAALLTPGAITTDDVTVFVRNPLNSPVVNAEIIKVADINTANAVTTVDTFRPNADFTVSDARHTTSGNTVPPFWGDVDEAVLNTADYLANDVATQGQWYWLCNSGGFATGRRVLKVTAHFVVKSLVGTAVVTPALFIGVSQFTVPQLTVSTAQTTVDVEWDVNPSTGQPWTPADIVAFATTNGFGFDFTASAQPATFALYQAWLTVDWVNETRLAYGSATPTGDGWLTVAMATPAGVDSWTPVAATQYALVLSTPTAGASFSWAALDGDDPHPDVSSASVTVTGGYPTELGDVDTAAPAIAGLDGAGVPLWGQVYPTIVLEAIYAGRTVQMEVTLPDANNRGWLAFVAAQASDATALPLFARLKRRSNNVQVFEATVDPFDVRNEPTLAQLIEIAPAAAGAGAAAQFYVEWACFAATDGLGWTLVTLSTESAAMAALSIGGTTDVATIAGVESNLRDVAVVVGKARTSPTGLTVVAA